MAPTLRDGDLLVARPGARINIGDVVVARYRSMPGRVVVKRTVRDLDGGWWLASDNEFAGGDSSVHGIADVFGRVRLRWRWGSGFPLRYVGCQAVRSGQI